NRQESQHEKHFHPRPARWREQLAPEKLAVTFDKRKQRKAEPGQKQAEADQPWFAEFFDKAPDRSALDERADQSAKDEQVNDGRGGFGRVAGDVETEVVAHEQRQSAFKAAEAKRGEKENANQ